MINIEVTELGSYIEKSLKTTEDIFTAAEKNNMESVISLLENRERLLNIVSHFYEKVMIYPAVKREVYSLEINRFSQSINHLIERGDDIEALLIKLKHEVQNEIAKVYKNKENLKGYNLNNTK